MAEPVGTHLPDASLVTGRVAEWGELLGILEERHGLTVIVSDPRSGTSGLLRAAVAQGGSSRILVDARACGDSLDLAMSVADAAVGALAPEALAWWLDAAPQSSSAGLGLWRALREHGIPSEGLRSGDGHGEDCLSAALELLVALADEAATLVIDHFGQMLAAMRGRAARNLLALLRAARQRHHDLDLVLLDHPDGVIVEALAHVDHPLYQAGGQLRFTRPTPRRIVDDLAITRPLTDVPAELLRAAAELAAGVPELTWQAVAMTPTNGAGDATRALAGWHALRAACEPSTRHTWDLLRRVHPSAQSVATAISLGLKPHTLPAASKTVNDALTRLRDAGIAWQPAERTWAISDPLLAAWAREHAPPWAHRRSASAAARARRGPA